MVSVNDEHHDAQGPGERLRAAREAAGLSVNAVADELQLLPSFVRSLEQNNYDRIRGDTFVRGYLSNYARLLGLDAAEVVAVYRRARGDEQASPRRGNARRKVSRNVTGAGRIGVVVTLLASSVFYLFHDRAPATPAMVAAEAAVVVEIGAGSRVVPLPMMEAEATGDASP